MANRTDRKYTRNLSKQFPDATHKQVRVKVKTLQEELHALKKAVAAPPSARWVDVAPA